MNNEEEPTVLQHLQDSDLQDLDFLKECFDYQATKRLSASSIEHKLIQLSQTPTWTNVAYHKYYD